MAATRMMLETTYTPIDSRHKLDFMNITADHSRYLHNPLTIPLHAPTMTR